MLPKKMATKKNIRHVTKSISSVRNEELLKENTQLKLTIENFQEENKLYKEKLNIVSERLLSHVDRNEYNIDICDTYSDIPVDDLVAMVLDIASQKEAEHEEHYLESRLEEVETRITQISTEFAKLVQLKLHLENGLEDLGNCYSVDSIHTTAKSLRLYSVKTEIFIHPKQCKTKDDDDIKSEELLIEDSLNLFENKIYNRLPSSVSCNLASVEMPLRKGKLPGDTHIKDMIPELKQLIIQHLSLLKGNGSDWRMFAERTGLSEKLIDQWKAMKLNQPMRNVLNVWSDSPGATVRLLHRHLVSPQLKCILLAKRITGYYKVD